MKDEIRTTDKMRIGYVDTVRGICIILVCLGHIMSYTRFASNPLCSYVNLFSLTVFFVLNGYTIAGKLKERNGFTSFLKKRAVSLLWPYLTFSALAIIIQLIRLRNFGTMDKGSVPGLFYMTFTGKGLGTLWFLPALFISDVLIYAFGRNKRSAAVLLLVSAAAAWLCPQYDAVAGTWNETMPVFRFFTDALYRGAVSSGLVACGVLLRNAESLYRELRPSLKHLILFLCLALTFILAPFTGFNFRYLEFGPGCILMYPGTAAAAWFLMRICEAAEAKVSSLKTVNDYLQDTGKDSLIIMATHLELFFVEIISIGMDSVFHEVETLGPHYYARCFAVCFLLLLAERGLCRFIKKFLPWMIRI